MSKQPSPYSPPKFLHRIAVLARMVNDGIDEIVQILRLGIDWFGGRTDPHGLAAMSLDPISIDKILVRVDERLRALAPDYLERRRENVRAIGTALERSDFEAIRDLGHKMTGTGAGYGFPRISEIGAAIEAGARARDAAGIRSSVAELARYLDQVELV